MSGSLAELNTTIPFAHAFKDVLTVRTPGGSEMFRGVCMCRWQSILRSDRKAAFEAWRSHEMREKR